MVQFLCDLCAFVRSCIFRPKTGYIGDEYGRNCKRILSDFYGTFKEIIKQKAPENYSAALWYNIFLSCLWEYPKLLISMISGFLDVSRPPTNELFLSLETPGHLTHIQKKSWNILKTYYLYISEDAGTPEFGQFWKSCPPGNHEDPS